MGKGLPCGDTETAAGKVEVKFAAEMVTFYRKRKWKRWRATGNDCILASASRPFKPFPRCDSLDKTPALKA